MESQCPGSWSLVSVLFLVAGLSGGLVGCTGVPSGIQPVDRFDVERYLGRWYEIARLDHSFERGLTHVTAEYSMRPDGRITVLNRGFDAKAGKWKQAKAVAELRGASDVGSLKVTFFWPFSAGYHVIDLDHDEYRYAMVTGSSRSMFWILSRTPSLPKAVLDRLLARAGELGFATGELIFVEQAGDIPPDVRGRAPQHRPDRSDRQDRPSLGQGEARRTCRGGPREGGGVGRLLVGGPAGRADTRSGWPFRTEHRDDSR